jgi:ribosomal protein L15
VRLAAINVGDIDENLARLFEEGRVKKDGEAYVVDVFKATGAELLLGNGCVRNKMVVTAHKWSPNAKEKIEKAGGSITGNA